MKTLKLITAMAAGLLLTLNVNAQKMKINKLTACNITENFEIIADKCYSEEDQGIIDIDLKRDKVTYTNKKGGVTNYRVDSKVESGGDTYYQLTNTGTGKEYYFAYGQSQAVLVDHNNMVVIVFSSGSGGSNSNMSTKTDIMRNKTLEQAKKGFNK